MLEHLLSLSAAGLFYDVAGVTALGFAFFAKSNKTLQAESEMRYKYNSDLMRSLVTSRLDGVFGSALLIAGFLLQLLGQFPVQCSALVFAAYAVLVLIITIFWSKARTIMVAKQCAKILALHKAKQ
ncbi:MAG: hypothetical protein ACLGHI_03415 [Gammaproteobacteria bacterium]